jgi:hypothetical protein
MAGLTCSGADEFLGLWLGSVGLCLKTASSGSAGYESANRVGVIEVAEYG